MKNPLLICLLVGLLNQTLTGTAMQREEMFLILGWCESPGTRLRHITQRDAAVDYFEGEH